VSTNNPPAGCPSLVPEEDEQSIYVSFWADNNGKFPIAYGQIVLNNKTQIAEYFIGSPENKTLEEKHEDFPFSTASTRSRLLLDTLKSLKPDQLLKWAVKHFTGVEFICILPGCPENKPAAAVAIEHTLLNSVVFDRISYIVKRIGCDWARSRCHYQVPAVSVHFTNTGSAKLDDDWQGALASIQLKETLRQISCKTGAAIQYAPQAYPSLQPISDCTALNELVTARQVCTNLPHTAHTTHCHLTRDKYKRVPNKY